MDPIMSQVTVSAIVVWLLEKLKVAPWFPAFSEQSTATTKKVIGALVAAAAAIGISYNYDPTGGVLTVKGLTLSSMTSFGWTWIQNFVMQQLVYHGVVKASPVKPA